MRQFTLKKLLTSVTMISIGIASASLPMRESQWEHLPGELQTVFLTLFLSSPALIGGGVGVLFDRVGMGVVGGYMLILLSMLFLPALLR